MRIHIVKKAWKEVKKIERICTCGELKNSTFVVYRGDLYNPKAKIAIPFFVNNKNFRNEESKSSAKQSKITVKFKTGARILKIKTEKDLIDLVNTYPSKYNHSAPSIYNFGRFTNDYKNNLPSIDLKHALTSARIEQLKKEYDGIHIADDLAKKFSDGAARYHKGDYLIFNTNILYDPRQKTRSIRKGTVGRRHKLSEKGLELSKITHKFCKVAYYARRKIIPSTLVAFSPKTGTYKYGKKDVTKEVKRIEAECNRIRRELKLDDITNKFDCGNSGRAGKYENRITMGYSNPINSYKFIRTLNAITFNATSLSKVTLEDVTRAVYLHELGHIKNNNGFRFEKIEDRLFNDGTHLREKKVGGKTIDYYKVEKSAVMAVKKETLMKEKLAWDFALRYDDSLAMKILATTALSTYQNSHYKYKKMNIGSMSIGNSFFLFKEDNKKK